MGNPTKTQLKHLNILKKADPRLEVRWSKDGGVARLRGRLAGGRGQAPEAASSEFLRQNKKLFGLDDPDHEAVIAEIHTDRAGNTHVRYQQMAAGVPVFGHQLIVNLDGQGAVVGSSGDLFPNLRVATTPKIDAAKALILAIGDARGNKQWMHKAPLLTVLIHDGTPHLCWQVTIEGTTKDLAGNNAPAKWEYFIDAVSGKVVWRYDNLQAHTQTTGTGTGRYCGSVILNTVHNHTSNNYELEDRWSPTSARIYTHDASKTGQPVSQDNNNAWNATNQGPDVDCLYYTRQVYEYFLIKHGRDSFDDAAADMHIWAHYGTNLNNAYWDGARVKIGDGDGTTWSPFSCLDTVAHEWTHAVTEYTAGLVYWNESGAINESMSDVFACLIEGDWLYGEDNWLGTGAPAGRNLADPTNGGQYDPAHPIDSVLAGHQPDHTDDQYTGSLDYGGVHINSGICNKAAHLIAVGGVHRNIAICEGLGTDILGRLYYQALTSHLTSGAGFDDLRDAVLDSLDDLYLGDPKYNRWRTSINNAFAAVGIGSALKCQNVCWLSPYLCPPQPDVCKVAPAHCLIQPISCKLQPDITCPPQPGLLCPPEPIVCKVQPIIECLVSPGGCLPGPDPAPFDPRIREQAKRVRDVRQHMVRSAPFKVLSKEARARRKTRKES